jgi:glucan phosphoethanolaminetransferase (alkaline phosphatase superfamily)
MKKYIGYPLLALLGGAAAFALRLMQNRTGYENSTGLPIAGNHFAGALIFLLVLFTALFFVMAHRLPGEKADSALSFSNCFRTTGAGIPTVLVLGAFAWIVSGGLSIYGGLMQSGAASAVYTTATGSGVLTPRLSLVVGCLCIFAGVCLLPVISACRFQGRHAAPSAKAGAVSAILLSIACLVVLLIITYREDSINPSLSVYYVELLAQAGLILLLYRISSFAYHEGRTRRFTLYSMLSTMLCFATLADSHSLAITIFYAGGILLSMGFLLLRLNTLNWAETAPSSSDL